MICCRLPMMTFSMLATSFCVTAEMSVAAMTCPENDGRAARVNPAWLSWTIHDPGPGQ